MLLFKVQMMLVDPDLVRPVKVRIVDLQVREGANTLLVTLSRVQVFVVILYARIFYVRQRISQTCSFYCQVNITCYLFYANLVERVLHMVLGVVRARSGSQASGDPR